jgi:hypothetical protein
MNLPDAEVTWMGIDTRKKKTEDKDKWNVQFTVQEATAKMHNARNLMEKVWNEHMVWKALTSKYLMVGKDARVQHVWVGHNDLVIQTNRS